MIEYREIKVNFNQRGDPIYDSKDLNINQYSKNVDCLSFQFEEMGYDSVAFSARRNDDEESMKIALPFNEETKRYEYVFGQDETGDVSTSSWFSYILGPLTITVYLVSDNQYKPMTTFTIYVNPTVLGGGESIAIPPTIADQILNMLNKKVDIENGYANGLSLVDSYANYPTTPKSIATKEYVDTRSGDYNNLTNKPQINQIELKGNKSFEDLGLTALDELEILAILT